MFVTASSFYSSLIFIGKAGAYPSEALNHAKSRHYPFPTGIEMPDIDKHTSFYGTKLYT